MDGTEDFCLCSMGVPPLMSMDVHSDSKNHMLLRQLWYTTIYMVGQPHARHGMDIKRYCFLHKLQLFNMMYYSYIIIKQMK